MRSLPNKRSGTTLVEVVLGLSLFCVFASSAFLAMDSSSRSFRTEAAAVNLDYLSRKALDEVCDRMRAADFNSITPAPAVGAPFSTLSFEVAIGFDAVNGEPAWGPVETLSWESDPTDPDDGIDNDADGLIDEGQLVWQEAGADGRRVVVCSWVSAALEGEIAGNNKDDNGNGLVDERGFCIEYVGSRALARLTLERPDPSGRIVRRSSTRTVTPRNTPE